VASDIQNLLSRFGATCESYLEFDDVLEYLEPPRGENPPPGVTKEAFAQAQAPVPILAAPEEVAAVVRPEAVANAGDSNGRASHVVAAGGHALLEGSTSLARKAMEDIGQRLRSRLNTSVTHGQAS